MGSALKTVAGGTGMFGALGAAGKIGDAMGIGKQGEYYQPGQFTEQLPQLDLGNTQVDQLAQLASQTQDPRLAQALTGYLSGQTSYQDMLNQAQSIGPGAMQELATGLGGTQFATQQLMQNPLLAQAFGGNRIAESIAQEKAAQDQMNQLLGQGFKLTQDDREAYGQASGDIARMFGQQEQNLAQSLAARGLGQAPSGAAGKSFSGLLGNKYEQLAKVQTDIADKRMANNLQRIQQTQNQLNAARGYTSDLTGQAMGAIQDQYGRQQAGSQSFFGNIGAAADQRRMQSAADNAARMSRYNAALDTYGMQEGLRDQSLQSKKANKNPNLAEAFGAGLTSGVAKTGSDVGSTPGRMLSARTSQGA